MGELDEVTLRRAQRGDDDACRRLVECYQARVFALLWRMVGARLPALVEDLAQDTFLQVFQALPGFSALGKARLSTWILTIASRRAIDQLRRPRREVGEVDCDIASSRTADESSRQRVLAEALEKAVLALAPETRAAFLLREVHGLDYADVARCLNTPLGTVKSRLSRARRDVDTALQEARHD